MNENDVVHNWLCGNQLDHGVFDDIEPINIYNNWCFNYDMDESITPLSEDTSDDFVDKCTSIENWYMPDEYKDMDIHQYLLTKLPNVNKLSTEYKRMMMEYDMFETRNMLPVLKFLVYLVDVCKENNIVLGVGRGSSVASYILYLIGVHRIDSIKYDLDIKEFLK